MTAAAPVTVRTATPHDAAAIAAIHVRTWQVAYRGQIPDEVLDRMRVEARERWWGVEWWKQAGAGHRLLVAVVIEAIIGFAAVGPSRDDDASEADGEVYAVYVDPSSWDIGVGRRLMDRSVDELRAAGFREATLWVLETNERARRFYTIAGWTPDGARKTEPLGATAIDEVRYRRSL